MRAAVAGPADSRSSVEWGRRSRALAGLLLLLGLPLFLLAVLDSSLTTKPLPLGERLPSLQLATPTQDTISLDSFDGRKLALLFFMTDCPHCRNELLNFEALHRRYRSHVALLAVSLSSAKETRLLLARQSLTLPVLIDSDGTARELFGIGAVPALFLADEHRILLHRRAGERSIEFAERELNDVLLAKGYLHSVTASGEIVMRDPAVGKLKLPAKRLPRKQMRTGKITQSDNLKI